MKKEILENIEKYKEREFQLILLIQEGSTSVEQYKQQLEETRKDRMAWLISLGGGYEGLSNEKTAELWRLVNAAESNMIYATINQYQLYDFINRSQKSKTLSMRDYERCVDDYGQLEFLADEKVKSSVAAIVKFNSKRNRKSFLSEIICKFKKAKVKKTEEKESE